MGWSKQSHRSNSPHFPRHSCQAKMGFTKAGDAPCRLMPRRWRAVLPPIIAGVPRRTEVPGTSFSALSSRWSGLSASDVLAPLLTPLTLWRNPPIGGRTQPYIQCLCSWHPPDGNPRSTAVRFRRGIHGVSKNAALLSGLSSTEEPGCSELLRPAVCSFRTIASVQRRLESRFSSHCRKLCLPQTHPDIPKYPDTPIQHSPRGPGTATLMGWTK